MMRRGIFRVLFEGFCECLGGCVPITSFLISNTQIGLQRWQRDFTIDCLESRRAFPSLAGIQ